MAAEGLNVTRAETRSQNRDHVSSRKEGWGSEEDGVELFRAAAMRMSGVPQPASRLLEQTVLVHEWLPF